SPDFCANGASVFLSSASISSRLFQLVRDGASSQSFFTRKLFAVARAWRVWSLRNLSLPEFFPHAGLRPHQQHIKNRKQCGKQRNPGTGEPEQNEPARMYAWIQDRPQKSRS